MSEAWLLPDYVFDGQNLRQDVALHAVDGKVAALVAAEHAPANTRDVDGILSPGFVDLQVNGGGGVLFNQTPSVQGIQEIAAAHRKFGTTGLLPTVITDSPDVLARAVDAVIAAKESSGVLGIHIEGPHISKVRRGTHAKEFVRPMGEDTFNHVTRLRSHGIAVLITLAPEVVSSGQIRALVDLGAVVSIGHSDATAAQVEEAIQAGARCATHLFNAMSPLGHRAPGVAGAVLNSTIRSSIILDGIHVADDMVALALRARPAPDLMFSVSDAMPTVGGPEQFDLYGGTIRLKEGRLVNAEGNLAGAHMTQAEAVFRLVNVLGQTKAEALRMAISVPASVIGRPDLATIVGQSLADLIMLDHNMTFKGFLAPAA
jgi:N-acetylglucosamine-6-phosphate deacetylase